MRMKVCHDHNQTEDLTLRKEKVGGMMDLLAGGPGLAVCSVPRIPPTPDGCVLGLIL
jgi:hypothetical protein